MPNTNTANTLSRRAFQRRALAGLRGLSGGLAGYTGGTIPAGTRIRFQAEANTLLDINLINVPSASLNNIVNIFRLGGYRIEARNTNYSVITITAVTEVDKVSLSGCLRDFENSCNAGLNAASWDEYQALYISNYYVSNVNADVLYYPPDHNGAPAGQVNTTNEPDPSGTFDLKKWLNDPVKFLGGAVTGATLALIAGAVWMVTRD
jgi:hypothetical protein